jgi:hypothetical protein
MPSWHHLKCWVFGCALRADARAAARVFGRASAIRVIPTQCGGAVGGAAWIGDLLISEG